MHAAGISVLFLVLALTRVYSLPLQDSSSDDSSSDGQQMARNPSGHHHRRSQQTSESQEGGSQDGQDASEGPSSQKQNKDSGARNPLVSSSDQDDGSLPFVRPNSGEISLEKPDNVVAYLQHIQGLKVTMDSVSEGYKKKNKNTYKDANIKIKDKNSTIFTRNGQVQDFEGPGFNMRTAVLSEDTDGKIKTVVVTATDNEKNISRNRDRLTEFVGTLNTDQFSSGALLTDHSVRDESKSIKQTVDGNRETNVRKQNRDSLTRGSFLKAANLSINARYQSDSFSNRQHQVSELVLGGSSGGSSTGSDDAAGGQASSGGAQSQSDDSQDE